MAFKRILPLVTASLFAFSANIHATPLVVSLSGVFSSPAGNQTDQLWSPNKTWAISFNLDSNPVAGNTDLLGFDAPFSHFTYTLNGSGLAVSPSFIRFSTAGNLGLFTLFFGPESGYLKGNPIPEFAFQGPQAFSGTTTSPVFSAGSYRVSDWTYSDALNYDENTSPASVVTLAPTPEPSTALLFGLPLLSLAFVRVRRLIHQKSISSK